MQKLFTWWLPFYSFKSGGCARWTFPASARQAGMRSDTPSTKVCRGRHLHQLAGAGNAAGTKRESEEGLWSSSHLISSHPIKIARYISHMRLPGFISLKKGWHVAISLNGLARSYDVVDCW
jgi:hypothetical protein